MKCDKCGRERNDCVQQKNEVICKDCIDEQKQLRKLIIKAKSERLYIKLGSRLDVKV